MIRNNLPQWIRGNDDSNDDGILGFLHGVESGIAKMIAGIGLFFIETMPDLWKSFSQWAREAFHFGARVAIRLVRVLALALAWAGIVFGPAWFVWGMVSWCWMAVTLTGSGWGLLRAARQRAQARREIEMAERELARIERLQRKATMRAANEWK